MNSYKNIDFNRISAAGISEILEDESSFEFLAEKAGIVKNENLGSELTFTGLLEFSNYCEENCNFCYYREENFSLKRFRMMPEEIISAIKSVSNKGIKEFIIESGHDSFYDTDMISYIIYSLKQSSNISIALALGKRGFDEYKNWKYVGADKYILPIEQTAKPLLENSADEHKLDKGLRHLQFLDRLGYKTGTHLIVGLPNSTLTDLANDILMIGNLNLELLSINPFVPYSFTPYQNQRSCDIDTALKTVAICRILYPKIDIPATPFLHFGTEIQHKAIKMGANAILPNITPQPFLNCLKIAYPKKNQIGFDQINYSYGLSTDPNKFT